MSEPFTSYTVRPYPPGNVVVGTVTTTSTWSALVDGMVVPRSYHTDPVYRRWYWRGRRVGQLLARLRYAFR